MSMPLAKDPDATSDVVHVALGDRAYDILIGNSLIEEAGAQIAARFADARAMIVTDVTVAGLHLPALQESLTAADIEHSTEIVEPGEISKSFSTYQELVDKVLAARLERGDMMIALGGGVVGDLTGFVAATVRRGMNFIQVPTTLLSQVDSSVGGKTGINSDYGKNLIGAFHQPGLVLADTASLETLPIRDFRAGYAELVKYGLIDDAAFFDWLDTELKAVFAGGGARVSAIANACRAKARVVAADEREGGIRALLNLGHTFGHALEAATGFGPRLVHGEAVAIGMAQAFRYSVANNLCAKADADRVEAHLTAAGLPSKIADIAGDDLPTDALMDHIAQDKKVTRGTLNLHSHPRHRPILHCP